jgi:hypothetical protein
MQRLTLMSKDAIDHLWFNIGISLEVNCKRRQDINVELTNRDEKQKFI